MSSQFELDSVVKSIIEQFHNRAAAGWKKYGTTLDRQDLPTIAWIQHAQEELMDGILYLEKLKKQMTTDTSESRAVARGERVDAKTCFSDTDHPPQIQQSPQDEMPNSPEAQ